MSLKFMDSVASWCPSYATWISKFVDQSTWNYHLMHVMWWKVY